MRVNLGKENITRVGFLSSIELKFVTFASRNIIVVTVMTAAAHLSVLVFYVFKMSVVFSPHSPLTDCPTISWAILTRYRDTQALHFVLIVPAWEASNYPETKAPQELVESPQHWPLCSYLAVTLKKILGPSTTPATHVVTANFKLTTAIKLCCDNCDNWYHKSCVNMYSATYSYLDKHQSADWFCRCCNSRNSSVVPFVHATSPQQFQHSKPYTRRWILLWLSTPCSE